jgi:hypothetical protein
VCTSLIKELHAKQTTTAIVRTTSLPERIDNTGDMAKYKGCAETNGKSREDDFNNVNNINML